MFSDLKGKRVVVTAGADGIGRAIARAFLDAGARVHICDVDAGKLAAFAAAAPGLGTTLADVADEAQVDRLFDEALAGLGGLDVLVNNAGIAGPTAAIEDVAPEDWRRTLAVNLDGQYLCARRAVPPLKQAGGGSIVNISSTAGQYGYALRAPYCASKWAVIGLAKTLATELGPFGIRANAVCPGSIEGERMARIIAAEATAKGKTPEEVRAGYARQSALRTFIDAEDIARTTLFVCSDAGARISGQVLAVDGSTEIMGS